MKVEQEKVEQATIASKYHTLTLLIGTDASNLITESCFTVNHRDKLMNDDGTRMYSQQQYSFRLELSFLESIADLPQLFLNITNLEIAARNVEAMPQIFHLLLSWAPQLQCLKMWFDFQDVEFAKILKLRAQFEPKNEPAQDLGQRCEQKFISRKENSFLHSILNQLPVLERFTLDLGDQTCYPLEYGMDWLMLSRLNEFRVNFKDSDKLLEESLKMYYTEDSELPWFGFVKSREKYQFEFRAEFEHLLPKVEILHLTGIRSSIICYQLVALTTLTLQLGNSIEPFSDVVNPLANLLQLKFLSLLNMKTSYPLSREQQDKNPPASLKSVLVLKLDITVSDHSEVDSIPWGRVFPAVQVIEASFKSNDGHFGRHHPIPSFMMANVRKNITHLTEEQIDRNVTQLAELICVQCTKLRLFYEYHLKVGRKEWSIDEYRIKNDQHGHRTIQKSCSFDNFAQMYQ